MKPAPPVIRILMPPACPSRVTGSRARCLRAANKSRPRACVQRHWCQHGAHGRGAGAGGGRRADRAGGRLPLPRAGGLPRGGGRRRAERARDARGAGPRPRRPRPDAARDGRARGLPRRLRGQAVQPARAGRQGAQRAAPDPRWDRPRAADPAVGRRPHDRPGDQGGRGRRPRDLADRPRVRAAAVPRPPPAPGVHPRAAPAAGLGVHLARRHLDGDGAHPPPAREGGGQPVRATPRPDRVRRRLPLCAGGRATLMSRRGGLAGVRRVWRVAGLSAAIFAVGLAGSVAVALAADVPAHDLGLLLGLTTVGALAVVVIGFVVQSRLRRRRAGVARHSALTAIVTAGAGLAAIQAVSSSMLISPHDLTVVLASLPVAVGAGVAYGVASAGALVADLEGLASSASALEAGAGGQPSDAEPRAGGMAEVAIVAEALDAAAARLAEARARERALQASRRDLVAWISHDLRTPLASLRALAEALADEVATDEATRRRYLAGLVTNVDRLTALVDDLFELSQIEAGVLELELEPTSLPELVDEVLQCLQPEAETAGVRLEGVPVVDGGHALVLAGRDQLSRVLTNLVHNGIRHTTPGGRLLVSVADAAGTDRVEVRVRDSCGGIAEADLPHVFERLWRGDPARSSRGAGLGLAIARGFVEAYGGAIGVANVPGGCEFTVELARVRPA